MRLFIGSGLLFACALAAGVAAAAEPCGNQLGVSAGSAELAEDTVWGELTEQGVWPGLGARAGWPWRGHCITLDGVWRGGRADYDGFLQNGTPYQTSTDHNLVRAELAVSRALDERFTLAAQLGAEYFLREIQGKGSVPGLTETYNWAWLAAGGGWDFCRGCALPLTARGRVGVLLYGHSDVDLGSFGTVDIKLDDATLLRLELEARIPQRPLVLQLYREQRSFARSDLAPISGGSGSAYQPAFDVDETGLALRFLLK